MACGPFEKLLHTAQGGVVLNYTKLHPCLLEGEPLSQGLPSHSFNWHWGIPNEPSRAFSMRAMAEKSSAAWHTGQS